jgi:hypothetical protein
MGMGLVRPNHVQTTDVAVTLREEIDVETGLRQTVVEQMNWTSQVSELYYINPDGSHIPAGAGGSFSRSFSEQDVKGDADASTVANLENGPYAQSSPRDWAIKRDQYQALQELSGRSTSYESDAAKCNEVIAKYQNLRAAEQIQQPSFQSKYTLEQLVAKGKNHDFSEEEMREIQEYREKIDARSEMFADEEKSAQRVVEASWQAVQAALDDARAEWDIEEARERISELERSLAAARRSGDMTTAEAGIITDEDGKTKAYVSMKFPVRAL